MKILAKLTLYFAGIGALAGCLSGLLSAKGIMLLDRLYVLPLLFAILFLYAAYKSAVPALKIVVEQLPEDERKKIRGWRLGWYGFPPFIIMWLIFWIIVYTMVL